MPFHIVGEHAEEHMSANAFFQPAMDRTNVEIDGLDTTKGALDHAERFVGLDRVGVFECLPGRAGAHGIEAVERGLLGNLVGLTTEAELVI